MKYYPEWDKDWRDHWPTTLEPTPARDASGTQAAHGSFYHITNIPIYHREGNSITKIMLAGYKIRQDYELSL